MPITFPLTVREHDGEQWPDKRITLAAGSCAVMISPRHAELDAAKREAQFLADAVNGYVDAVPVIDDLTATLMGLMKDHDLEADDATKAMLAKADALIEKFTATFDELHAK